MLDYICLCMTKGGKTIKISLQVINHGLFCVCHYTEVGFTRERTILIDLAQTVSRTKAEMFEVIL